MDILELPVDLIWEGKLEPQSPSQLAFANSEDILIFDNDFAADILPNEDDISKSNFIFDLNKSADFLFELQEDIFDFEDDSVDADQWLDTPINLPILDDYPAPSRIQPVKVEHTAQLLREFDSVFDAVELTHLTPPQTPPQSPIIQTLKPQEFLFPSQNIQAPVQQNYYVYEPNFPAPSPMPQDIAHEMEVVEELVRSRAEHLPDRSEDEDDSQSTSSSSECVSPRSESSYASSVYSIDDEWSPKLVENGGPAKRRTRPYGRSSDDKKFRKKEQNKNAATRYRKKKKAECEVVLSEERQLQDINDDLQTKCADVQREIKYLKSLMRDLYRAKGLL